LSASSSNASFDDLRSEPGSEGSEPERIAEQNSLNAALRAALCEMDSKYKMPLLLYYFCDNDLAAIARICTIPQGTVKSRLFKGRELMRDALLQRGFSDE
jgi:RNA polymerase sigma-70 factor (ECF subfamily)